MQSQEAAVPADNRAFRYGYGLFETMLVKDGHIRLAGWHMERLLTGMEQLHFSVPAHFAACLSSELVRTVKKNKLEQICRVRLQVYPGSGGLYDHTAQQPGFVIECFPLEAHVTALNTNGLVTGIATGITKAADSLSHLKTCNALVYAMAAQQARLQKWNDALICNTDSQIIESTIANLFWIKNDQVYTPPLSAGCIAGVMRRYLLQELPQAGWAVTEQPLTPEALAAADEVFLTNAIRGIKWVKEVNGNGFSCDMVQQIAANIGHSRFSV